MSETNNNQVAIVAQHTTTIVDAHSSMAAAMVYGEAVGQMWCSVPKDHPRLDEILWKCNNEPDGKIADMINSEIKIAHLYGKQAVFVDEATGEETSGTITCFITPDCHVFQCASNGIRRSIAEILQRFGEPSKWPEPITVKVRQISKGAKRWFALQLIRSEQPKAEKKK